MGGLFNRLQNQLDKRDKKNRSGISAVDLLVLEPTKRRIMRLLLRHGHLTTYDELLQQVQNLPENQTFSSDLLDKALADLTEARWLYQVGEDDLISYRVNLRRKSPSQLGGGVWDAIDSHISKKLEESNAQSSLGSED